MTDEYKVIDDKRAEMSALFDRMDRDEALYLLEPYVMRHLPPDNARTVDDVANITMNDPLLFATKVIGAMGGMVMQTVVEGRDMKDKQATKIEEFLDDIYYMIDEYLVRRGIPGLDAFINEQITVRGRIGARSCIRLKEKDHLVPDVLPLDTRNFIPSINEEGLVWGAPWFTRTKEEIERQYPGASAGEEGEVVDFWDSTRNKVFIEQKPIAEVKNPYGYPPLVYVTCPVGSMLGTKNAAAHQGESIFWANRELWPEMNRCATILQTLNVNSLFSALQYESTHGENMPKPEKSPYKPRTVHGVEKGGGYKPIPVGDIKAATRLLYSVLETRLQRASLSAVDYGTLTFPLSAIAIQRLSAARDDIFLPRVQAKALFRQALSRMIIKQCIALDTTLHIGKPGSTNTYTKADLEGDYTINYRIFTESGEQAIANLQIAAAASAFLSGDTIRREVLHLQDPDGEETKFLSEQSEKVDEVLFLYRRAVKLIEDEKELEAYILAQRIRTILKQRKMQHALLEHHPPGEERREESAQPGQELMPLLAEGRGGMGGRRSPPAEEGMEEQYE